jgi:hypothetical protein
VIVKAVLEKLATDDGLVQFGDHAEVGREYLVHLDSIRRQQAMVHHADLTDGGQPIFHAKDIIWTVEGIWLPLECLRLLG